MSEPQFEIPRLPENKGGRPTKFTPELVKRILKCVERGMPLSLACEAAGIEFCTLQVYRKKHPGFAVRIKKAAAKGAEKRLAKIVAASNSGDWRAAAWLLEHTKPEFFARNRLEITGADGSPLAAAVAIYLPQKDVIPEVHAPAPKEISNGSR
ncbi:MAG TPA: hypothetical protein VMF08_20280 [Candidatus Sulfotelmatobacter sp.]|nr:hypothetical protein [Candidatus Sulfotelmatobacter sp.]